VSWALYVVRKRGTLAGPLAIRLIGREPLITFVTFGELAKWAEIRNWASAAARNSPAGCPALRYCPAASPGHDHDLESTSAV
jgi:hypothetical protein